MGRYSAPLLAIFVFSLFRLFLLSLNELNSFSSTSINLSTFRIYWGSSGVRVLEHISPIIISTHGILSLSEIKSVIDPCIHTDKSIVHLGWSLLIVLLFLINQKLIVRWKNEGNVADGFGVLGLCVPLRLRCSVRW